MTAQNQLRVAVQGRTCATRSTRIEKVSGHVEGVVEANVNLASPTRALPTELPEPEIEVTWQGGLIRIRHAHEASQVEQAVASAGFVFVGAV